jgi:hypothetical protein
MTEAKQLPPAPLSHEQWGRIYRRAAQRLLEENGRLKHEIFRLRQQLQACQHQTRAIKDRMSR